MPDSTTYHFNSPIISPSAPLSINLPPHLQNLTIRALIRLHSRDDDDYASFLPAAIQILKTAHSLHRITLEIDVDLPGGDRAIFDVIDLSPLTDLAESPPSSHRIDLHFKFDWHFMRTKLISRLANDLGLAELMEQGVLVVHLNEDAPQISLSMDHSD
jgi:hypothetical protein